MVSGRSVDAGGAAVRLTLRDQLKAGLMRAHRQLTSFASSAGRIGTRAVAGAAAAGSLLIPAIRRASDAQETASKFNVVFGSQAKSVLAWGDAFATSMGRAKQQVSSFLASSQDLFQPLGFDAAAAEDMSKSVTKLAFDLASFNNVADEDALADLHAALTGSGEVMKKYGVIVNEAGVKQQLLNQGLDPRTATEQQKVMARYAIILAGTTAAQGDLERTSGSFANQMKRLRGTIDDALVSIGEAFLPALSLMFSQISQVVTAIGSWMTSHQEIVLAIGVGIAAVAAFGAGLLGVAIAAKALAVGLTLLTGVVTVFKVAFAAAAAIVGTVTSILGALIAGGPVTLLVAGIGALAVVIGTATGAFAGLGEAASSIAGQVAAAFQRLVGRVMDTFGAIRNALAAGDLALAAKILWLALQAEWSRGTAFVMGIWDAFVTGLRNAFTGITTGIAEVFLGTMGIISRAVQGAIDLVNKLPGVEIDADVVFDAEAASKILQEDAQREVEKRLREQQAKAAQRDARTAALEAELAAAKAEATAAAEKARMAAEETDAKIETQKQALALATRQAPAAARELSGASGTFSAFAAQRISGEAASMARRTLEAMQGVEQNTEDMLEEMREGLFSFA